MQAKVEGQPSNGDVEMKPPSPKQEAQKPSGTLDAFFVKKEKSESMTDKLAQRLSVVPQAKAKEVMSPDKNPALATKESSEEKVSKLLTLAGEKPAPPKKVPVS
jgi:predicted NAD/FAD-dependent oxidoreductase